MTQLAQAKTAHFLPEGIQPAPGHNSRSIQFSSYHHNLQPLDKARITSRTGDEIVTCEDEVQSSNRFDQLTLCGNENDTELRTW